MKKSIVELASQEVCAVFGGESPESCHAESCHKTSLGGAISELIGVGVFLLVMDFIINRVRPVARIQ